MGYAVLYSNFAKKPTMDATKPVAKVKNEDGSISTVRSMSFQDDDGLETVIPTVHPDGYIMSNQDAVKYYRLSGNHLGKFSTTKEAVDYAKELHNLHDEKYSEDNKSSDNSNKKKDRLL